jgi:parallel beta-helix repeat protein
MKKLNILWAFVLIAGLSLTDVIPAAAAGNTWYVNAATGSDVADGGSAGNPWASIQYAVNDGDVIDGDTIIVADGTYTENIVVNKRLTIRAADGAAPTVTAVVASGHVFHITVDDVTISGFHIKGATDPDCSGIFLDSVSGCTITGNTCGWSDTDYNDKGIYLEHANNNTLSGNICKSHYYGIHLYYSNNNTLSGNSCDSNNDAGIYLDYSSNNAIAGNTCKENDDGIELLNSNSNTISGNTCELNTTRGIYLYDSSSNTILGNICSRNSRGIFIAGATTSNNMVNLNLISNNVVGVHFTNNITAGAAYINHNNIFGNTSYGISNLSNVTIDAIHNWWGQDSGPTHSGNPGGTGDKASDYVDYSPWANAEIDNPLETTVTSTSTTSVTTETTVTSTSTVSVPTTVPVIHTSVSTSTSTSFVTSTTTKSETVTTTDTETITLLTLSRTTDIQSVTSTETQTVTTTQTTTVLQPVTTADIIVFTTFPSLTESSYTLTTTMTVSEKVQDWPLIILISTGAVLAVVLMIAMFGIRR